MLITIEEMEVRKVEDSWDGFQTLVAIKHASEDCKLITFVCGKLVSLFAHARFGECQKIMDVDLEEQRNFHVGEQLYRGTAQLDKEFITFMIL